MTSKLRVFFDRHQQNMADADDPGALPPPPAPAPAPEPAADAAPIPAPVIEPGVIC